MKNCITSGLFSAVMLSAVILPSTARAQDQPTEERDQAPEEQDQPTEETEAQPPEDIATEPPNPEPPRQDAVMATTTVVTSAGEDVPAPAPRFIVEFAGDVMGQAGTGDQEAAGAAGLNVRMAYGHYFHVVADIHTAAITGTQVDDAASLRQFLLAPNVSTVGALLELEGTPVREPLGTDGAFALDLDGVLRVGRTDAVFDYEWNGADWIQCSTPDCPRATATVVGLSGYVSLAAALHWEKVGSLANTIEVSLLAGVGGNGYFFTNLADASQDADLLSEALLGTRQTGAGMFYATFTAQVNAIYARVILQVPLADNRGDRAGLDPLSLTFSIEAVPEMFSISD